MTPPESENNDIGLTPSFSDRDGWRNGPGGPPPRDMYGGGFSSGPPMGGPMGMGGPPAVTFHSIPCPDRFQEFLNFFPFQPGGGGYGGGYGGGFGGKCPVTSFLWGLFF